MPVMSGYEALKVMQLRFQDVKPVVLSIHNDLPHIRECLSLGARGYLSKDCIPEQLVDTLMNVQVKGFYMEESTSKDLLQNFAYMDSNTINKQKLSKRENEILKELIMVKQKKQLHLY